MSRCKLHKCLKYMMLFSLILIMFVNLGLIVRANEFDTKFPYVVTIYNEKNGLPTGEANTIIQTRDGHIWIGSYGGLICYDGSDFRNFSAEKVIESDSIRSLYEDSQGRLWIGTNDMGVLMMQNDVFTLIESPEDNSFLCVRDFVETSDGSIYIASPSGIAQIVDSNVCPLTDSELSGMGFYSLAMDSYKRVWGCTDTGECVIIKDGKLLEVFPSSRVFEEEKIYCIDSDEKGNIVVGTSDNVAAVISFQTESLDKGSIRIKKYSTGQIAFHNVIESIGGYLMVSGNNGLAVIAPNGVVQTYGEKERAISINAMISDYEDNLWMASSNYGIIKYSQGCFESINEKANLEGLALNVITKQDMLWYIGHDAGLIICNRNWLHIQNELTEMFRGIRIRNIFADSKGNIWIASYSSNPLVCYKPNTGEIVCYNESKGLVGDKARAVKELSDGRIITSTQNGVFIIEDGKVTEHYGKEDGITNTTILCFAEDQSGEILIGSDGDGIYSIKDGKITNYGFEEGLSDGVVLRIKEDTDGNGYFVSAGSNLYYWINGEFEKLSNFTKDTGSIFDIYDKNGKIWILQNNGVISMNKNTLLAGEDTETIHYGFKHGLAGSLDANTWHYEDGDGKLYLATRNGVSIFGFQGVPNTIPKMCISRVVVDGEVYEHPSELILPCDAQRITVDFATLTYTDTIELRVMTRLQGFDDELQLSSQKSDSVSYTNLPGGEYVFELTVLSPDAGELMKCTLPIIKKKKITEYSLFWILLSVALVALSCTCVLLYAKAKLRAIQRRQQEYKSIIEQALKTFAKTIDAKDPYTNGHSLRVAKYARELARRMGMSEVEQENIYYIALLHDIGKIGIPDQILNKPGKLTDEELATIRKHVTIGGEILEDFTALDGITEGARYHHERWDGKGYGEGLAGLDIPKVARIIGVADSYDAMSSNRCYRNALAADIIESELINNSETQFDPEVVPHMLDMIREGVVPMKDE